MLSLEYFPRFTCSNAVLGFFSLPQNRTDATVLSILSKMQTKERTGGAGRLTRKSAVHTGQTFGLITRPKNQSRLSYRLLTRELIIRPANSQLRSMLKFSQQEHTSLSRCAHIGFSYLRHVLPTTGIVVHALRHYLISLCTQVLGSRFKKKIRVGRIFSCNKIPQF